MKISFSFFKGHQSAPESLKQCLSESVEPSSKQGAMAYVSHWHAFAG